MRRIHHASGVLGQARGEANSNHLDSSVLETELGWGGHSFSTGVVSYGSKMHRQSAVVYVTEKSLIIVSVSDGDRALSRMTRNKRQEQHWECKISHIEDIHVLKEDELRFPEFFDKDKEKTRQCAVISIRNCADRLYVDTYDSPSFSRHLVASWHACVCTRAAKLGKVRTNSNPHLAREYLDEVIKSYTRSHDLKEKIAVLDELAGEVLMDLEMKEAVFCRREMLVLVLGSCHKALNAPSGFETEVDAKIRQYENTHSVTERAFGGSGHPQHDSPRVSPRESTTYATEDLDHRRIRETLGASNDTYRRVSYDNALQQKLEQTVINRMHFFHSALRLFVSLFFNSHSIGDQVNALTENDPLSPNAWMEFLGPDLLSTLCRRLKCNLYARLERYDQEELMKTLGAAPDPLTSGDFSKFNDGSKVAADESLHAYSFLLKLRRSVSDYQIMASLEVCRIASMGIRYNQIGRNRVQNRFNFARSHIPMGELWVRQTDFDVTLEAILNRISSLLSDIVITERAKVRDSRAFPGNRSRGEAGGAAGIHLPENQQKLAIQVEDNQVRRQPSVPPSPGKGSRNINNFKNKDDSVSPARISREERRKNNAATPQRSSSPEVATRSKRDSFVMLDKDYKKNMPTEVVNNFSTLTHGVLETQEVLLYYCCSLLQQLVHDSSKVREVLGKECQALWPPIAVIMNVICPRNTSLDGANKQEDESSRSNTEHRGRDAPSGGMGGFLQRCLGSNGTAPDRADIHEEYTSYITHQLLQMDIHSTPSLDRAEKVVLPWCRMHQYGPPKVHVDKYSWELIVFSRRCIDDCMNIMGLHGMRDAKHASSADIELEMSPRVDTTGTATRQPTLPSRSLLAS